MDAQIARAAHRPVRVSLACLTLAAASLVASSTHGAAAYRTANFTVAAETPQLAKEIGDTAEKCRRDLAIEWLGHELPNWPQPCPITAQVAPHLGAGGATSFIFDKGQVFDWKMNVQGSRERVLDSVIPHEVTHTVFASHFRQPLPRWADEGACTTVEHRSEIAKQERMLIDFLKSRRGIPFNAMFVMKDYPQDVLPLYAQGHSLARFLIDQRGKQAFLNFLADGMRDENWQRAIDAHYGYEHLLALQNSWLDWVKAGRPQLAPTGAIQLASAQTPAPPEPPTARDEVGAGMIPKPAPLEASRAAAPPEPSREVAATPATPSPATSSSGQQPSAPIKSVYGENPSWRPQRQQPSAPTPADDRTRHAAAGAVAYDASRATGAQWR